MLSGAHHMHSVSFDIKKAPASFVRRQLRADIVSSDLEFSSTAANVLLLNMLQLAPDKRPTSDRVWVDLKDIWGVTNPWPPTMEDRYQVHLVYPTSLLGSHPRSWGSTDPMDHLTRAVAQSSLTADLARLKALSSHSTAAAKRGIPDRKWFQIWKS